MKAKQDQRSMPDQYASSRVEHSDCDFNLVIELDEVTLADVAGGATVNNFKFTKVEE